MQLGVIGLGRMGANIVRRVMRHGHQCVVYDRDPQVVKTLADEGATGVDSMAQLASHLRPPRVVWLMVPAGQVTTSVIDELAQTLQSGDTVIDGGNTYYRDDIRHAQRLGQPWHPPAGLRYQRWRVGPGTRVLPDDRWRP